MPKGRDRKKPRESAEARAARAGRIVAALARDYPEAECALRHENAFQLLVATILSAQCTDARVNMVTPELFRRWPDARALAAARQEDVEKVVHSTGFYRNKAKNLLGMAAALVARHGGEVPQSMDELTALPGVARKTANVLLGTAFGRNDGVVVDTHVSRVSQRLGLTREDDPVKIERDLMALLPRDGWTAFSHRVILHGRRVCDARKPRCGECSLRSDCTGTALVSPLSDSGSEQSRAVPLVFLLLLLGACSEPSAPDGSRDRDVAPLHVPTDAEREAADKLAEAKTFLAAGKAELAEPLLRRAAELLPDDAEPALLLADCLFERRRPALDEAIPLYRRVLAANPKEARAHERLVLSLKANGQIDAAEAACRAWAAADDTDPDAHFHLGTLLYEQQRAKEAVTSLRKADALTNRRPEIPTQLALALAATGQLDKAETRLRDVIAKHARHADAWFQLGDVLTRKSPPDWRGAAAAMSEAVELDRRHWVAHLYLYRACRAAATGPEDTLAARGEQAWRDVLRIESRRQVSGGALGPAAAGPQGGASEFVLKEAVTNAPDDGAPRVALARFLQQADRFDEAAAQYERAVALGVTEWKVRVRYAAALLSEGRRDAQGAASLDDLKARAAVAREQLAEAAASAPSEVVPQRLLAWAWLVSDRPAEARASAAAALSASPGDEAARRIAGLARMREGDLEGGLTDIAAAGW